MKIISIQDPTLLSSMDPAQIAAAVQHCPIPLDSALQVPETLFNFQLILDCSKKRVCTIFCRFLPGLLNLVMPLFTRYFVLKVF